MKLTHIHHPASLFEAMNQQQLTLEIAKAMMTYVEDNNRTEHFQLMYYQAVKLFPQFRYTGKMYRQLSGSVPYDDSSRARAVESPLYKAVAQGNNRALMQLIKSYPQYVYSWSKSKQYATASSRNDVYGHVVLEQTGEGLDLFALMEHIVPLAWPEEEYTPEFAEQQEVLGPMLPTARVLDAQLIRKGDPNRVDDEDDWDDE